MAEDKRNSRPTERDAVYTTIVGGRPPGCGTSVSGIPRGIEVLVKKAAVDPAFKALLLERRGAAADEIGLALDPAEAAMLGVIPRKQLEGTIARTTVRPEYQRVFLGKAAALMLAALGGTLLGGCTGGEQAADLPSVSSTQPDPPPKFQQHDLPPEKPIVSKTPSDKQPEVDLPTTDQHSVIMVGLGADPDPPRRVIQLGIQPARPPQAPEVIVIYGERIDRPSTPTASQEVEVFIGQRVWRAELPPPVIIAGVMPRVEQKNPPNEIEISVGTRLERAPKPRPAPRQPEEIAGIRVDRPVKKSEQPKPESDKPAETSGETDAKPEE